MLIGIYSQLQEVIVQWSVQVVTPVACVPSCPQRPSANLGLHVPPWTRAASILGWRIIALSPPFLSACRASRPSAPAAPATLRLGSLLLYLLTGKALATHRTLAFAAGALKDGHPVVETGPAAAGIEFHQVLIQGPLQVLAFGLQGSQVHVPQQLVNRLCLKINNSRIIL